MAAGSARGGAWCRPAGFRH